MEGVTAIESVNQTVNGVQALNGVVWLDMLWAGWYASVPLLVGSVLVLAVALERIWRYRGLESATRQLTRHVVDALVKRDVATARALCQNSKNPVAKVFHEGLRWRNIALEDLDRVLATSRQEAAGDLRRGLWVLGTIGSLAPFVGLFGTVIGIMKAFHQIAVEGSGGFEVVAAGISEALIATALGLGVAIVALALYNYLQIRVGGIGNSFARACERFVQALLYLEAASESAPPSPEMSHGHPQPA